MPEATVAVTDLIVSSVLTTTAAPNVPALEAAVYAACGVSSAVVKIQQNGARRRVLQTYTSSLSVSNLGNSAAAVQSVGSAIETTALPGVTSASPPMVAPVLTLTIQNPTLSAANEQSILQTKIPTAKFAILKSSVQPPPPVTPRKKGLVLELGIGIGVGGGVLLCAGLLGARRFFRAKPEARRPPTKPPVLVHPRPPAHATLRPRPSATPPVVQRSAAVPAKQRNLGL